MAVSAAPLPPPGCKQCPWELHLEGSLAAAAEVRFDSVRVPEPRILGQVSAGWQALDRSLEKTIPILCALQVGACQEILDFTLEYTRTRMVFGQPIGCFQRIQDNCVDLSMHLDAARRVTNETLWKRGSWMPPTAGVHEARAVASDAMFPVESTG